MIRANPRHSGGHNALKMLFGVLIALCVSARLALAQSQEFGQCGGEGWTGATTCVAGTVCIVQNPFYSQCVPGTGVPPSTTITSTSITSKSTTTTKTTGTTSAPSSTSTSSTGLNIRLLPLGDSITYGFTTWNTVDFIGSIESGTMVDNNNEGHIGAIIEQIAGFATNAAALPARPNVVLLMAGTNDVIDGLNATAPAAISSLMDAIFVACPDTALIVATLTPLTTGQAGVDAFNAVLTTMISARAAAGKHILLTSMAAILASDLIDGIHPTDAGYVKMADAWFTVVEQAAKNGWIGTPVTV
ncbi:SGNH hydrolase-type esterase domain-containing protein [Mycena sp. CBHHK59/15]|nr:SGNH hydrolase-type esterase domain-containing protein [Mycena sp. CBHHK59/15]